MRFLSKISILILILTSACVQQQAAEESKLFDFDLFLKNQAVLLTRKHKSLEKSSFVKDQASDSAYMPSDTSAWKNELQLFSQLEDFNKAVYRKEYILNDSVKDTKSNLRIKQYTAEKAPVRSIRFYYHDLFSQLKKIEAVVNEDNPLYANNRMLVMEFDDDNGTAVLTGYTMTGYQKIVLRDSVRYSLTARVK